MILPSLMFIRCSNELKFGKLNVSNKMNPIYIYDLNMFTLGVFLVNNIQRFVNRSGFYLWKQQIFSSNALLNVAPYIENMMKTKTVIFCNLCQFYLYCFFLWKEHVKQFHRIFMLYKLNNFDTKKIWKI